MSNINTVLEDIARSIVSIANRLQVIESTNFVIAAIKTTTGDPASGREGQIVINTFDNNAKIYADGGWRTIASGW